MEYLTFKTDGNKIYKPFSIKVPVHTSLPLIGHQGELIIAGENFYIFDGSNWHQIYIEEHYEGEFL